MLTALKWSGDGERTENGRTTPSTGLSKERKDTIRRLTQEGLGQLSEEDTAADSGPGVAKH